MFWPSVQGHRVLPTKGKYIQIQRKQGLSDDDYVKKVNNKKLVTALIKI